MAVMGLADRSVVSEPFRTWRDAGLHFLLDVPLGRSASPGEDATQAIDPALQENKAEPKRSFQAATGSVPTSASLPEPWAGLVASVGSPLRCVWTYAELALDLGPSPCSARRTLWRNMLTQLAWPKNSVLFMPYAVSRDEKCEERCAHFWEAVRRLKPKCVVVFGKPALDALLPGAADDYGVLRGVPHSTLFLPGPSDMLPDDRRMKRIAWEYLRHLFPG